MPDRIQCFVIEIFREPAKSYKTLIFSNRKVLKLIFYS